MVSLIKYLSADGSYIIETILKWRQTTLDTPMWDYDEETECFRFLRTFKANLHNGFCNGDSNSRFRLTVFGCGTILVFSMMLLVSRVKLYTYAYFCVRQSRDFLPYHFSVEWQCWPIKWVMIWAILSFCFVFSRNLTYKNIQSILILQIWINYRKYLLPVKNARKCSNNIKKFFFSFIKTISKNLLKNL